MTIMKKDFQVFTVSRMVGDKTAIAEIHLVTAGCCYFFNAQHLYLQISNIKRSYFDFICEKMDHNNRILLNPKLREEYIYHYNKVTSSQNAPSMRTLQRYEITLRKLKLIIKPIKSGAFVYVNPKYAFKGKLSARPTLMNRLADMAFKGEIDLSTITDRPIESILPK
jgi:hypothetical protein